MESPVLPLPRGFKQRVRSLRKSLSGYHATVADLLADGDKVIARYTGQGTHNGSFLGIAPTGRLVTYSAILIWRLVEGKVAEEWTSWDALGVLHQLGAVPLALSLSAETPAANIQDRRRTKRLSQQKSPLPRR